MLRIIKTALLSSTLIATQVFAANLSLDNEHSWLNFISNKNAKIAEVSKFRSLSGDIDKTGQAKLMVDLNSVFTKIDIRDERMRKYLFETDKFPTATISSKIDLTKLDNLRPGQHINEDIEATISLHGVSKTVKTTVTIFKANQGIKVNSIQPILINANDYGLLKGVEKLKSLAGLNSINIVAPVSFSLLYK